MLKIQRRGFSSYPGGCLFEEIGRLSKEKKRSFLIVPEQQTVITEGVLSKQLSPESVLYFEVTNFTRFANTAFRTLGGISGEYSDKAKKALIMWRTLTELSPVLNQLSGKNEVSVGLVEKNLSAVAQLQSLGIHPEELSASAEMEALKNDRRLYGKISDLSKVYALYKKLLGERYSDTGDDCEALANLLLENPEYPADTKIYIEGFTSFTEPQYKVLAILSSRTDVTVLLNLPRGREDAFEFLEIRECERRLVALARKNQADVKIYREDDENNARAISSVCDNLWVANCKNVNVSLQNEGEIRIFEAQTPFEECEFICSDIKRRVMEGASYSDFAIVARSAQNYSGILDTALLGARIPAFTSVKRDVTEFEAIKLIYIAYSAVKGFSRNDVITYSKCHASGVTREESDEFELYVNTWQISGERFTDDDIWNMHPDGLSARRDDRVREKLLRIHGIRKKIIDPLYNFSLSIADAKTASEHARALYDFLLSIGMEASLEMRARSLELLGEVGYAEENRALWRLICSALDTVVTVLGDTPCDTDSFFLQLKVVFGTVEVGRIPAYVDEVTVGSADMLRLYGKPHVYMIGVNSGEFPAFADDNSYFSEHDRLVMSGLGLEFPPELETKTARELYIFSRAFSYASESVTLSYSNLTTRFKPSERSAVINRITEICEGVSVVKISSLRAKDKLYCAEHALGNMSGHGEDYRTVSKALSSSGYEREVMISESDIENSECRLSAEHCGDKDSPMVLSQSEIDAFKKCPFAWYCKYSLSLSENDVAEFDARSIGVFIHAVLENFFTNLRECGRDVRTLSEEERRTMTKDAAQRYFSTLGDDSSWASTSTKIKLERLCRAAQPLVDDLCDEFSKSRFTPRFFELSLSNTREDAPAYLKIKEKKDGEERVRVLIKGTIDRVDTFYRGDDVYLRVVDYKTGSKDFTVKDMEEGRNLQMFLYLKAICDSENEGFSNLLLSKESKTDDEFERGKAYPAGVIYVKTPVGDERVKLPDDELASKTMREARSRSGMILDDEEIISAMGVEFTPLGSKKDPTVIDNAKRKYLYNEDGWKKIMQDVEKSVLGVAEKMTSGDISARPDLDGSDYSPCTYCKFKPLCRKVRL